MLRLVFFKKKTLNCYMKNYINQILFILILTSLISNADCLLVENIIFQGNSLFTDRQLKQIILTKENSNVDRTIINDDAKRIYDFYVNHDFYAFKVYPPEIIPLNNKFANIVFKIEELVEPKIADIFFTGNSYFSDFKIKELINETNFSNISLQYLQQIKIKVIDLYLSRGFLFVNVQLVEINKKNDSYIAKIMIDEGKIVRADNFVFQGNNTTKESILMSESRILKNQVITPQTIAIAERRIESKQYIKSCKIFPVNENTILFKVEEGKMTHLSALLGYSKSEKKNSFNGFINADFLNLMGTDRSVNFNWKKFDNGFSSVLFKYHESGPLRLALASDIKLYREERDSTYTKTDLEIDVYYYFQTQRVGLSFGIEDLYPGARRPKIVDKQEDKKIGIFWDGDFSDDFYNPRNGWKAFVKQYFLFVKKENEELKRFRNDFSLSHFYSLNRFIVVANSMNTKYLENKSLTYYDLFKAGGSFSVRGFYEDSFAGNVIVFTNTELRFLLTRYSRAFLFVDYCYVEDNRPDLNNRFTDLIGMGFGLRAESRIGLLRLDYGFHHANKRWLNPLNGIIHFGIETSF